MSREILEVTKDGETVYCIYCNTQGYLITIKLFEDEETAEKFLRLWHKDPSIDQKIPHGIITSDDILDYLMDYVYEM